MAKGKRGRPAKERLKVSVPESLTDITVGQYLKFRKYNITAETDNDFVVRKVLQAFYNISPDKHDGINQKDLSVLVKAVLKVLEEKPGIITRFTMGDIEWGLIPNIDAITFGEYVDMRSIKPAEFDKLLFLFPIFNRFGYYPPVLFRKFFMKKNGTEYVP